MANQDQRFEQLKQKYQPVLRFIEQVQVRMQNLHVQDNKLFIRAEAPSEEAKNKVWDQIKLVDPTYQDLTAEITVAQRSPAAVAPQSQAAEQGQTYTVQPGDSLSKISKRFYGDANQYMLIFNANRDKLRDPDKIQPGQKLLIPAA